MRKILITGATSGFGKLLVEVFLKHGDLVIATGRNLSGRTDLFQHERQAYPGQLFEYSMDITHVDEIELVKVAVSETFQEIDILVNNAGHGLFGALEDLTDSDIRHQMEVNFFGILNVTKAFLPLLRNSRGKIFNISSVFGFMGFPLTSLYCASKFAVEGLSESLRWELASQNIQVCLIEPGGYGTKFGINLEWGKASANYQNQVQNYKDLRQRLSQKRRQDPREVAEGILFLSQNKRLPMRKVFGSDGKVSYFLRRFLPSIIYFRLMDLVFKGIFERRRS